jgi:hypothetical protein
MEERVCWNCIKEKYELRKITFFQAMLHDEMQWLQRPKKKKKQTEK